MSARVATCLQPVSSEVGGSNTAYWAPVDAAHPSGAAVPMVNAVGPAGDQQIHDIGGDAAEFGGGGPGFDDDDFGGFDGDDFGPLDPDSNDAHGGDAGEGLHGSRGPRGSRCCEGC